MPIPRDKERLERIRKKAGKVPNWKICHSEGITLQNLYRIATYHGIELPRIYPNRKSVVRVKRVTKEEQKEVVLIGVIDEYMRGRENDR